MQKQFGHSKIVIAYIYMAIFIGCSKYSDLNNKKFSDKDFTDIKKTEFLYLKSDTIKYKFNNLLYFEKNDSIFIVVTHKEMVMPCEKLLLDHKYNLKLKPVRPPEILNYLDYITSYPMYNNEIIDLQKGNGILWDLFITSDIIGTCYQN